MAAPNILEVARAKRAKTKGARKGRVGRRVTSPRVAEPPPGRYSHCQRVGNHVYISGQISVDKKGNLVGGSNAYKQAKTCFNAIKALMEAAGGTVNDVVKINMYTTDMRYQPDIWKARSETFSDDFPTSTLLAIAQLFSPDLLVEIEAIGYIDD